MIHASVMTGHSARRWTVLATHGELNENDPLASGLLLAPGGKDDGCLEVREIFGLDLTAQLAPP